LANLSSSFKRGGKLEWLAILVNLSNENGSIIKSVYFLNEALIYYFRATQNNILTSITLIYKLNMFSFNYWLIRS